MGRTADRPLGITDRGVEAPMESPEAAGNTLRFHPARVEETSDWLADEDRGRLLAASDGRRQGAQSGPRLHRSGFPMASAAGDAV